MAGTGGILDGLARERAILDDLRVVPTSSSTRRRSTSTSSARKVDASATRRVALRATVMSFGFKYGVPVDADIVIDVRFLPNPFWVPELRDLTGLDPWSATTSLETPEAREFLDRMPAMLDLVCDGYLREGKRYVTVAVGCTGGKHRSVAMSENLAARLVKHGVEVLVHRDLGRE